MSTSPTCSPDLAAVVWTSAAMLGRGGARDARAVQFERTEVAQPLMFAVEYALATTLMEWGLRRG